jgi:hypothetical protein
MAHLHFHRTVYKSGGQKAAERVNYITRAERPEESRAERQLRYINQAGREDLVYTRTRNLPAWAEGNPHTYFQAAERQEWALGNAFEEWKITLPQELSQGQNMALMRDLVDAIAGDRLPITYAFHCPATLDKAQEQPHLHLLISARQSDGITRTPAQHFKKYNKAHPERGGAPKDQALYHLRAVKQWRVTITDIVNLHLERAGCAERVHPDRLEDRAIDRKPEPKLRPSESRAYRDKGVVSDRMAEVLATRAQRQETRGTEQADARSYWEERKSVLGITDGMDGAAQLAAVSMARAHVRDQAPARAVVLGEVGVEIDDRALGDLAGEVVIHAQADAQALWVSVQDLADASQLRQSGRERIAQAGRQAQAVWREAGDEQRLLDLGQEARDDAWHDAVLLWAEDQGTRVLRDVGWEAVQDAWETGQEGLAGEAQRQQLFAQAQAWASVAHNLQALTAQLDALQAGAGETGQVRIRLWEQDRGIGL